MKVNDIRRGDIITYRSGRVNYVNNPDNYYKYFNKNFENKTIPSDFDIVRIQRYVKILCLYKIKTIYLRYV